MSAYLLTWNPDRSTVRWIVSDWRRQCAGKAAAPVRWSCGSSKNIPVGSRVFLLRQRVEPRGIVASGWVIKGSYQDDHWDEERAQQGYTANFVDCRFDAVVKGFGDKSTPVPLEVHRLDDGPIHEQVAWNNMPGSGVFIPVDAARELERLWALHIGGAVGSELQGDLESAVEGIRKQRLIWSRSREVSLRDAKIREALRLSPDSRLRCEVPGCGFCFEEVYGEVGREYAHVHHLSALSGNEKEVQTTLKDLAIVCANCHAMIHRRGECRPLEGLVAAPRRGRARS